MIQLPHVYAFYLVEASGECKACGSFFYVDSHRFKTIRPKSIDKRK